MDKKEVLSLLRYTDKDGIERWRKGFDSLRHLLENHKFDPPALTAIAAQVTYALSLQAGRKRKK